MRAEAAREAPADVDNRHVIDMAWRIAPARELPEDELNQIPLTDSVKDRTRA